MSKIVTESVLRKVLQTKVAVMATDVSDDGEMATFTILNPGGNAVEMMEKIEKLIKKTEFASVDSEAIEHEGKSAIKVLFGKRASSIADEGQSNVTTEEIMKALPTTGKIDVIGISGELGCTADRVRQVLETLPDVHQREYGTFWMNDETPNADQRPGHIITDAEDTEAVKALRAALAALTPEERAAAAKMGLVKGNRPSSAQPKTPREPREPRARKVVELKECACGCGGLTKGSFCMGHDARAKGRMLRAINGKATQDEIGWKPTPALVEYVHTHPDWNEKFGAWVDGVRDNTDETNA